MKMLRELTRKQFVKWKFVVLILAIVTFVNFVYIANSILSQILGGLGFAVSMVFWLMFKQHELYDNMYKDTEKPQKIIGKEC